MKNAIAIFLLFTFTCNIAGSQLILIIQRHHIRREMVRQIKEGISESQLTIITITPETVQELTWKDKGEFRYKGEMYDIVYVENLDNNTKIYHCIWDKQETELIAEYSKQQKKNRNSKNRTNTAKTVKFFQETTIFLEKEDGFLIEDGIKTTFAYSDNYTSLWLEISSPPPKPVL